MTKKQKELLVSILKAEVGTKRKAIDQCVGAFWPMVLQGQIDELIDLQFVVVDLPTSPASDTQ